jgi:hypothetical protein
MQEITKSDKYRLIMANLAKGLALGYNPDTLGA